MPRDTAWMPFEGVSIPEAGAYLSGAVEHGMIQGYGLALTDDVPEGDRNAEAVAVGHHDVVGTLGQEIRGLGPQEGAKGAVEGRGDATPLDVAQGGEASLHASQLLELPGKP